MLAEMTDEFLRPDVMLYLARF